MFDFKVLSRQDLEQVLDMGAVIPVVEGVYRQRSLGQTDTWPTVFNVFQEDKADVDIKSGWLKGDNVFGHKTVGWYADNEKKGLPAMAGLICIYDAVTGAPLGITDGTYITGLRTGAAGGIGAKLLARADSRTLLIVGAGNQCTYQAAATVSLMPGIERILVSNPHNPHLAEKKVQNLASEIQALGVDPSQVGIEAAPDLEAAASQADVIITATMSRSPLIKREWVQPGTHFSCIGADMEGKIELDPRILADAILFADDTAHCIEAGEMEVGLKQGVFGEDHIVGEIGGLLCGTVQGRSSADDITVLDATGMALLDIACARQALQLAEKAGFGVSASV